MLVHGRHPVPANGIEHTHLEVAGIEAGGDEHGLARLGDH